jgi:tetratricopeptide (TPR) repeat protein
LGGIAMHNGRLEEAERLFRQAIARHDEIGDPLFLANAIVLLRATLFLSGRFAEAQALGEESAPLFDATGDPVYQAGTLLGAGIADMHQGRWEQAKARTRMGMAYYRESGVQVSEGESTLTLGRLALVAARQYVSSGVTDSRERSDGARAEYARTYRLAQESLDGFQALGRRTGLIYALSLMAAAEAGLGHLEQARNCVQEAVVIARDTGAFQPSLHALSGAALLLANEGQPERAVDLYALAARHPLVDKSRWFDVVYAQPINRAAAALPSDVLSAARQRGRARHLQATLRELAEELGQRTGGRRQGP